MTDGMMQGMLLAATLLSSTAILLSVGLTVYLVRRHRENERVPGGEADPPDGAATAPRAVAAEDG